MADCTKNNQKSPQGEAEKLPDAGYVLALRVVKSLQEAGYDARLAGGCVRDRLLGIRPKDYDVACNAHPDTVCLIFKQKNIKVVPTGIDHGTVTVVIAGQGIEVTSLRKDVSTDGRRATVSFGSSFEEDAERRDFTFNAMFEDASGKVYDYFGGLEDLRQKRLRFVGDAEQRIREDYLRILRMFRFWARFHFVPDRSTLAACQREAQGLSRVSQERISYELLATLEGDFAAEALEEMASSGILRQLIGLDSIEDVEERLSALKIGSLTDRALARLALLYQAALVKHPNYDRKLVETRLKELRIARDRSDKVLLHLFCGLDHLPKAPAEILECIDQWEIAGGKFLESILPLWRIIYPQHKTELDRIEQIESSYGYRRHTKVPLDGQKLMASFDVKAGPELGQLLQELKRSWRLGIWQSEEEGLKIAAGLLQKQPRPQ